MNSLQQIKAPLPPMSLVSPTTGPLLVIITTGHRTLTLRDLRLSADSDVPMRAPRRPAPPGHDPATQGARRSRWNAGLIKGLSKHRANKTCQVGRPCGWGLKQKDPVLHARKVALLMSHCHRLRSRVRGWGIDSISDRSVCCSHRTLPFERDRRDTGMSIAFAPQPQGVLGLPLCCIRKDTTQPFQGRARRCGSHDGPAPSSR